MLKWQNTRFLKKKLYLCRSLPLLTRTQKTRITLMKKILILLAAAALSACTSVSTTDTQREPKIVDIGSNEHKQMMLTNYGYYLFNWIPIFSGGREDNSFALFTDTVNVESAVTTLSNKCVEMKVDNISDIQTLENSTCYFSWIPYFGTTFGLYWYREVQVSAVVSMTERPASPAIKAQKE